MNKFLLLSLIFILPNIINAKVINSIAYKVNEDIITTYDIKQKMKHENISNTKAVS